MAKVVIREHCSVVGYSSNGFTQLKFLFFLACVFCECVNGFSHGFHETGFEVLSSFRGKNVWSSVEAYALATLNDKSIEIQI